MEKCNHDIFSELAAFIWQSYHHDIAKRKIRALAKEVFKDLDPIVATATANYALSRAGVPFRLYEKQFRRPKHESGAT